METIKYLNKEDLWKVLRSHFPEEKMQSPKEELTTRRGLFDAIWDNIYLYYIKGYNKAEGPDIMKLLALQEGLRNALPALEQMMNTMHKEAMSMAAGICNECQVDICAMREILKEDPKGTRIEIEG